MDGMGQTPQATAFFNCLDGQQLPTTPIPKWGWAYIVMERFNADALNDVDVDMDAHATIDITATGSIGKRLVTDSVAACHAICIYGFRDDPGTPTHIGMFHTSDDVLEAVRVLAEEFRVRKCTSIATYVLGGWQSSYKEYIARLLKKESRISSYSIKVVVSPVSEKKHSATVLMDSRGIKFFVSRIGSS